MSVIKFYNWGDVQLRVKEMKQHGVSDIVIGQMLLFHNLNFRYISILFLVFPISIIYYI